MAHGALFVSISLLLLPLNHVTSTSMSSQQPPPGTSSLTFVFDTTGSMHDDLVQVQEGARRILDTVLNQREKLIYNYVYVPFNDPGFGPPFVTTDSHAFQRHLNSVFVTQGGDCPEMALSGIQLALETSLPSSYIYVFTDARAKDFHLKEQIINLSQEKQSNVVFVMTGDCSDRTHPGSTVYETIAAVTFGQVFHLEKTDVEKVLDYVKHQLTHKKVTILYEKRDSKTMSEPKLIPVDSHMSHLEVSLSGDHDASDSLDVGLINPNGQKVEKYEYEGDSGTLDLRNIKIIRIKNPMPGHWTALVNSGTRHIFSATGNSSIHLSRFGFDLQPTDNIEMTDEVPMAKQMTYLMVNISGLQVPGYIDSISLVDYKDGRELYTAKALAHGRVPYLYYVGPFEPPSDNIFYVVARGKDEKNYDFQRVALRSVKADKTDGPRAYMARTTTVPIYQSVNLTCSVTSKNAYELYWYRGDKKLSGPFFYSNTSTALWTLNEVRREDQGRYYCRVLNTFGKDSAETTLIIQEPKPEITFIRNDSTALGQPAYLHCRTQTPYANVKWYRSNIPIQSTRHSIVYPNGTLYIPIVRGTDGGPYVCRVTAFGTTVEKFAFLKLLELPRTTVYPRQLFLVPGVSFNISCYARGDPTPEISWYFDGKKIKPLAHKYYITYRNDLIVQNPTEEDVGVYKCFAKNRAGVDSTDSAVELAVKPKLRVVKERQLVNKGSRVVLECVLEAGNPKPKILWYRAGREIPAYRHIEIKNGQLIITISTTDAGSYSCVAQNIAGHHRKNLHLAIGSLPSIQPSNQIVRVDIEKSISLPCRANGYPVPSISWRKEKTPINLDDPQYTLLQDGSLYIKNAQLKNKGFYTCTAQNAFGTTEKTLDVWITGLVAPVLVHMSPEEQLTQGGELRLSCIVKQGNPAPVIYWFKNGQPVINSDETTIEASGSVLHLRNGNIAHEGHYTCVAYNVAGNATLNVKVNLIKKPIIERTTSEVNVKLGQSFSINCQVLGQPPPTITWNIDGAAASEMANGLTVDDQNTLHVRNATVNHDGSYTCIAKNMAGEDSWTIKINVLTPPVMQDGRITYNTVQGDQVKLQCSAIGRPPPVISWYFNNTSVDRRRIESDGSLVIPLAREADAGYYKCIAENVVGKDEKDVIVTVHTVPEIEGAGQPIVKVVVVNNTILLPCPAHAVPEPKKIWEYENEGLKWDISYISQAEIIENGTLMLSNVQLDNAGKYKCQVSNLAGTDYIVYVMHVISPSKIVKELPDILSVVDGHALEIPCKATGYPEPIINWIKDGLQVTDNVDSDLYDGTLRIRKAEKKHEGRYRCMASNPAGNDTTEIVVKVQEPALITNKLPSVTTVAEGEKVELKCEGNGDPPPNYTWFARGSAVDESNLNVYAKDATLSIERVRVEDAGLYSCHVFNGIGGGDETYTQIQVMSKPVILNANVTETDSVLTNQTITLYCPVYSTPLPQVTWKIDNQPIAEADINVKLSEDKRRLQILNSRVANAGIYKCIARNRAGVSWKTFNVEVLVPPTVDESKYKTKVSVLENSKVEIGCPIHAVPSPTISWLLSGKGVPQMLNENSNIDGVTIDSTTKTIVIPSAQRHHQGTYTCTAKNKAATLDVDVELTVLAPPKIGKDEVKVATINDNINLHCDFDDRNLKLSVSWLLNGSEILPANAQVILDGRRLYLNNVNLKNEGEYQCRVRNTAGESRKSFSLRVLAPPRFREKEYAKVVNVSVGSVMPLSCEVDANPPATITWLLDNKQIQILPGMLADNEQTLNIQHNEPGNFRYTCIAKNNVSLATKDVTVQVIAPPEISEGRVTRKVLKGNTLTLECPVSSKCNEIKWFKEGKLLPKDNPNIELSLDHTRVTLLNVQKDDEATFSCVAKNFAGQAVQEIDVVVEIKPRFSGSLFENISIRETDLLEMECGFEADPRPDVWWNKDGGDISERVQLLNEGRTGTIEVVNADDSGTYQCKVNNSVGTAVKTFNVHVISKPEITGSNEPQKIEANITSLAKFACPVKNLKNTTINWVKDGKTIEATEKNIQVTNAGQLLLLSNIKKSDQGLYSCIAENVAGKTKKLIKLNVLIPPTIAIAEEARKVAENQTIILPCKVDGNPVPTIKWNKDGVPVNNISVAEPVSDGQQLKIGPATPEHSGTYYCVATNKVGKTQISFDVDVISRPSIVGSPNKVVKVVRNDSAVFKCLVKNTKFDGVITWLKDYKPFEYSTGKYALSQGGRKLQIAKTDISDEGMYTCRVRNYAGENKADYELSVLVPPEIFLLDKDKNRKVIENSTLILNCPTSGRPEPVVQWYKDGELLHPENISKKIKNGEIDGNQLRINLIEIFDSGRYTCESKNEAATVEQDILVYVMTKPSIERSEIPDTYQVQNGDSVTLSCPTSGRPPPTIKWFKSGQLLQFTHDVYQSSDGMKLHLLHLTKEDADQYTCVAENEAGEDRRDFSVLLQEAAKIDRSNIEKEIVVIEGKAAILNCPATGIPEPNVFWLINGQLLDNDGKYMLLSGGRQLHITNVAEDNAATYTCMAKNDAGIDEVDIHLNVIVPPLITGSEMEEVEVEVNHLHELNCDAIGTEPIETEWQKDGQLLDLAKTDQDTKYLQISSRNRRLHILSAQESHSGKFTCIAKNSAGTMRKAFDLKVIVPPTINETASSASLQNVIPGSAFTIHCNVYAVPKAQISWLKDGQPLPFDVTVLAQDSNRTIWVKSAANNHEGKYVCKAVNKAASTSHDFYIKVTDPPILDQAKEEISLEVGAFVILTCKVISGSENLTYYWTVNGKPLKSDYHALNTLVEGHRVQIQDVRVSDTGSYVCVAENEAGRAKKEFKLSVLERPRFLDDMYLSSLIIVGRPLTLDCSVSGTPTPTIRWTKVS